MSGEGGAAGSAPTRGGERAQQAAPLQADGAAGSAPTDRWGAWQPLNQIRRDGEQARGDEEERVSGWSAEADA